MNYSLLYLVLDNALNPQGPNPADPYHAYYRHRMDRIAQGDLGDEASPEKEGKADGDGETEPAIQIDVGQEPPAPEFIMDLPNISSIDL